MPQPIAVLENNTVSKEVAVTPVEDRAAGVGFYDSLERFLIPSRPLTADVAGTALHSGVFRCLKQTLSDSFSIGDRLTFSANGVQSGSDPLVVIEASAANEKYVIAELRSYAEVSGTTTHLDGLRTMMANSDYLTKLQGYMDAADDYGEASLQFPYYSTSIYAVAECNAAEALNDPTYIDRIFQIWDTFQSAHNVVVERDAGIAQSAANGYSNPQASKGAGHSTYMAVESAYFLWMMEWAAGVWEICGRIVDGNFATESQKAKARGYAEWVTVNTVERYMTGTTWNDMNQLVERAAEDDDGSSGGFAWDDKYWLAGTCLAYITHYYPLWGNDIPGFMTLEGVPSGRPRMDFGNWYRHMIGESLAQGENGPIYSKEIVSGSVIDSNGCSYLAPNSEVAAEDRIDDVFHDARRLQFWRAMETYGTFIDSGTETRHNLHGAGFRQCMHQVFYQDSTTGGWNTKMRVNGSDEDRDADPGGHKPVWHWGSLMVGDPQIKLLFQHIIEAAQLPVSHDEYLSGYDEANLRNMYSWAALAEAKSTKIVDDTSEDEFLAPPPVIIKRHGKTAAQLASAANIVNYSDKYESKQEWDSTNKRPVYASGASPTSPWRDATGAIVIPVAPDSSYASFAGTDDYVYVPVPLPVSVLPLTFSAWIRTEEEDGIIAFIGDSSEADQYWRMGVASGKAVATSAAGTAYTATSTTDVDDGEWHHVVGVFSSTTSRKIYVDGGTAEDEETTSSNPTGVDRYEVGRSGDSTPALYFIGDIASVRLYGKALSDDEITWLHTGGASGTDPTSDDLESFFQFSKGTGTTIYDKTATAANGTASGIDQSTFWNPYVG